MCYSTQMPFIFVILFSDIVQCFRPAQTKIYEDQNRTMLGQTFLFFLPTTLTNYPTHGHDTVKYKRQSLCTQNLSFSYHLENI